MALTGSIRSVNELSAREREQMYGLMATYYENVTWQQFTHDLAEKHWAALLADERTGEVRGFSTLMRLHACVDERPVVAFFSGDTIIHRDYRGKNMLPRLLLQHGFAESGSSGPARVYWFLICSGYKTYRYLPLLFRAFYPSCEQPTPPHIQRTLDTLARLKFPAEYDPASGIVRLAGATPLRPGVADLTSHRLNDPHVAFFAAANAGHSRGDELVCLAELTPANLTRAGRRALEQ